MLIVDMVEEAFGMEAFDMEEFGEVRDTKELCVEAFHIEELV